MSRNLLFGSLLTALVLGAALLGLGWTPHATDTVTIAERLQPPSAAHWLGTDHFDLAMNERLERQQGTKSAPVNCRFSTRICGEKIHKIEELARLA